MAVPSARRRGVAATTGSSLLLAVLLLSSGMTGAILAQDDEVPSQDGSIRERDLWHDSRDDRYRTPTGAVPAGTPVTLRLRSAADDLTGATARFTDRLTAESWALPMERVASDPDGGDFGYDFWEVEVATGPAPAILDYMFVAEDGSASRHLFDDRANDGGTGEVGRSPVPGRGFQLTAYDPDFTTPEWAHGAVAYQVFPDRFANGDPSNDPSPEATPGPNGAERYRHGDVYGDPVVAQPWDARPENHCRGYVDTDCPEPVAFNRDFFGGDLAGITAGLDDLADLGVTVLYLNPIFASPSNHRYDTSDYGYVDPGLGGDADFDRLVVEAGRRGIRIVLDGVFNHVSSDSPWFDRFDRFDEVGACESADSRFRDWFTFKPPSLNDPEPCVPTEPGGSDTFYQGWFDYDTIPELQETDEVQALFVGEDGVVPAWIARGAAGWRLDAADVLSGAFIRAIRDAAKAADPGALIIAEQWHDSTPWLLGDQADSTMNYRFRRAVIGLVNGATNDPDGALEALTPSGFASAMSGVQEDYPPPAFQALMNLVDSHDTARILWTLTPGVDNDEAKSLPSALAEGKVKQRLVATIQLTFPGMATIYYGDEVGLSGHDDPDNRRPYPWAAEDLELREHYRTLARVRAQHEALREGGLEFLYADDPTRTLAFLRRSPAAGALIALNLGQRARELQIGVSGRLPDGLELTDALGNHEPVVVSNGQATVALPPMSAAVLLSAADADLLAPPAPTSLSAVAGAGRVDLSWETSEDAAGYEILRSLLSGGGYASIGRAVDGTFSDDTVRDGVPYHYVVTALDNHGNASGRSPAAAAVPRLSLTGLQLLGLDAGNGSDVMALEQPLSAIDGAVRVRVHVASPDPSDRLVDGIIVEVGLGSAGSDPATDDSWAWSRATFDAISDVGADVRGLLQPESLGSYDVAARASTDGGQTWLVAAGRARLESVPGADTTAPIAPGALEAIDVAGDRVRLRWSEPIANDLYRYLVLRADESGGPYEVIGSTTAPFFTDASVSAGRSYAYAVKAQDSSFNTSAPSRTLDLVAEDRLVDVVLTVSVPEDTTPSDTVYIAGDFQGWDPAGTPMTQGDDKTWTITLSFLDREAIEYKYTRGSWDSVEKDDDCAEIANRTLTTDYGAEGIQDVADRIAKWRDLDACG